MNREQDSLGCFQAFREIAWEKQEKNQACPVISAICVIYTYKLYKMLLIYKNIVDKY